MTPALTHRFDAFLERGFVRNLHLLVAFILYLPFTFLGYGEESDSFIIVDAGKRFLQTHTYNPSRRPGAAAYEIPHAVFNAIGGSVLSNLMSLAASMVFLGCFTFILKRYEVPQRHRLVWGLILLPIYWNNSTVTQDYVWAMAFALLGLTLALRNHYMLGGALWGVAVGSRATSVIMVVGFLVFLYLVRPDQKRKIAISAIVGAIVGISFFLPMLLSATPFAFLQAANWGQAELWTPYLRVGRFVYKNIYIWGLPGTIGLAFALYHSLREYRTLWDARWRPLVAMCVVIIAGHEAMFFQYPMKPEYLLPVVPFVLIIVGIGLQQRPAIFSAFLLLTVAYTVVNLDVAKPNIPGRATSAKFALVPKKGRLIHLVEARLRTRSCESIECFARVHADQLRLIEQTEGSSRVLF